ncbi:Chromatin modification-related protein eaf3 [Penicillium sp. IBT 18751x]|nr:Chromatin modification-related protein eaf3 [Penicillium sp. IBT 18751x]
MPPSMYSKDEKVLCFHQELLYDAKILEVRLKDPSDKKSPHEYLVHYKGWKNTWDDWVLEDRLRKASDENRELASNLRRDVEQSARKQAKPASKKRAMSDRSSVRDSEERGASVPGRGGKRARGENDIEKPSDCNHDMARTKKHELYPEGYDDRKGSQKAEESDYCEDSYDIEQSCDSEVSYDPEVPYDTEESFSSLEIDSLKGLPLFCDLDDFDEAGHSNDLHEVCDLDEIYDLEDAHNHREESFNTRPSIRIVMPDNLKSLIVDDWERVTKNGSVVALPAPKPVRQILQDWRDEEEPKRRENRIDVDVLDEVIAGMLEYFDVMLDKVLLYRYERAQYRVLRNKFQETKNFGPVDVYGAEHLIRLFSLLPELLAQTNMDVSNTQRMREELSKLSLWLSRNSEKYFRTEYIPAEQSYDEADDSSS